MLLVADVVSNYGFISPDRGNETPSGPEMLPHEMTLSLCVDRRQVNRTLALADDLRHRILRRIANVMCT